MAKTAGPSSGSHTKITRRNLAARALASAAAVAQTTQAQPAPDRDAELLKAAQDQVHRTGEILSKYEISMATEPAFQFKA